MSIYIYQAFIDYLKEEGKDINRPMIEYRGELMDWKKQYNNR